jgi:protein TonB
MLAIVLCHAAIFYAVTHARSPGSIGSGQSLFGPVISAVWQPPRQGLQARWEPPADAPLVETPRQWRFPPIDLWPSPQGRLPAPSGFTPVTDAQPDPPDSVASPDQQPGHTVRAKPARLRMSRWLRPEYPAEWAGAGVEGRLLLNLRIEPQGRPVEILVEQRSGSPELDEAVLHAAPSWRFAWPPSKSAPEAVWARIELRFNGSPQ